MASAEAQGDNLTDGDLQSEIELVGDLVVAATSSDGPMSESEIDRLLGIDPSEVEPGHVAPGEEPASKTDGEAS